MFSVVRFYADTSIAIAKAIFAGATFDRLIDCIRRITEVRGMAPERRADLDTIFSQLKSITDMRNRIIHYGTFVTRDKGRITSTARRALTAEQVEERGASVEILKAMTADIQRINTALLWDFDPKRPSLSDPSLSDPWRYIPELRGSRAKSDKRKKLPHKR